jgi:two-component system, cell cycle response regulator
MLEKCRGSAHIPVMGPGRTVVVIDDDPGILNLILMILTPAGFRVICCGEPGKAVELVRQERPDVVLCDIAMPGLDGYAVHEALESDPATADIPFLFLTAQGEFTQRVRAARAGVVEFMKKPFTQSVLVRKIEKMLERSGRGRPKEAPAKPVPREPSTGRRGVSFDDVPPEFRRVLVVDDDRDYRGWLRQLLQPHGFTVLECGDGEQALRQALEGRPWLVLADVDMPEMDGVEMCRRFRADLRLRAIPLVFISGYDDYEQRRRGLEAGADEYLPKLLPVRELLMRIHLALQRAVDAVGWRSAGIAGDLDVIGPVGALQMCHLGRLTGVFEVRRAEGAAEIRFREGEVVGARCGGAADADAVFQFLGWTEGRFEFRLDDPGPGAPLEQGVSELVLEGCRRLDEARR